MGESRDRPPERDDNDGGVRPAIVPTSARTPQIVAHRGSSRDEPEHTLKAYLRAIDEGADALECDVRLTADGHLVCVHDRRVNRTSNGVGRVSTLELADARGPRLGVLEGRRTAARSRCPTATATSCSRCATC